MTARAPGGPRVRYIAFRIETPTPVSRQSLINAIRDTGRRLDTTTFDAAQPWLTRYDGTLGIIRCQHTHVDATRALLGAMDSATENDTPIPIHVTTLATSGTIKSLTDHALKELRDPGRRR